MKKKYYKLIMSSLKNLYEEITFNSNSEIKDYEKMFRDDPSEQTQYSCSLYLINEFKDTSFFSHLDSSKSHYQMF